MKQTETNTTVRIIVVGAGKAGELVVGDIKERKDLPFELVGFVDDDLAKAGKRVAGLKVLGTTHDLPRLIAEHAVEELLIAIPSERGKVIRDIVDRTAGTNVDYKIIPRLSEVLLQDFKEDYIQHIRRVRAEDLLGGELLKSDQREITRHIKGRTIMITGAAGSIGSELSRQIVAYGAKKVVMYDWWENGTVDLRNQILEAHPKAKAVFVIGDVKDAKKVSQIMAEHKPDAIFHAAAYKHVPLMEGHPSEAIRNNLFGTKIVAEAAIRNRVKKFVLISTDKAVNPTNIMGATKRAAEQMIHILAKSQNHTIFCAVRFGNVINSNGSVIPFFQRQIEQGGPVGVTHPDITRFFMTIPEAVHLVLQSWVIGENDDLFVLDMGESVKIYDLVKSLIALEGYEPDKDIRIEIIGLRPGEKLYEEVLIEEEKVQSTSLRKIFRTRNHHDFDELAFLYDLSILAKSIDEDSLNVPVLREQLQKMVVTYKPAKHSL